MQVTVRVKSVYGNELIYPADHVAELLVSLTGRKTFSRADLEVVKQLGYDVQVKAPEL